MDASISNDEWDNNIDKIQQGINSTKHKVTNATPTTLMLGINLRMDRDEFMENERPVDTTTLRKIASERLEDNRKKQDESFNKKRREMTGYDVGDLVLT